MTTFGTLPGDVVTNSRGDVQAGVALSLYATQADATAPTGLLATVTTDAEGRWSYTDAGRGVVWVRTSVGRVYATVAPDALPGTTDASALTTGTLANARLPVTAQAATLSSTYARVVRGTLVSQALTDGTDQSATVIAEIAALYAAGGGTYRLPVGTVRIDSQVVIPNTAASGSAGSQPPIIFVGVGAVGPYSANATGSTVLDLRHAGDSKILSKGFGVLTFRDITFREGAGAGTTPFIFTTNTTLRVIGNAFIGNTGQTLGSNTQDAILLGGIGTVTDDTTSAPYQGYGSLIKDNFFDWIRYGVHGRTYCNGVVVRDNTWWTNCGGDAAILFEGLTASVSGGNVTSGNLIEMGNYTYGIRWVHAQGNAMLGDQFWDGATATACVRYEGVAGFNTLIPAQNNGVPEVVSDAGLGGNTLITSVPGLGAEFNQVVKFNQVANFGDNGIHIQNSNPAAGPGVTLTSWTDRLFLDGTLTARGTAHQFGPDLHNVCVGSLGTTDGWVDTVGQSSGSGTALHLRAQTVVYAESPLAMQAGQSFKPAATTTAGRPTASSAGAGATFYDSTLGITITSNGTAWVNGIGTVV